MNLPAAAPSASPLIFNLPAPAPSDSPLLFNLPAVAPSVSPTSSAPSSLNYPSPSSSPLLVENYLQYGPPIFNLGYQQFGLPQPQFGLSFQGFQGGPLLPPQIPVESQFSVDTSQVNVSPTSDLGLTPAPLGIGPVVSTTPSPLVDIPGPGSLNIGSASPTAPTPIVNIPGPAPGNIIIHKHVYVHVAPEDPEDQPPKQIITPPARRNYKIIFIKAPSAFVAPQPVAPPQPKEEERTIIYVLVKRPENQPEVKIEAPPATSPSKPEVYFIRYNTRKEGGTIQTTPASVESTSLAIVQDRDSTDPTVPTARFGSGSGLHTSVDLNLNKASLSGGSALSLAVSGSPSEEAPHVSTPTPAPKYGPPEDQ